MLTADHKSQQIVMEIVFSVALPSKKHRQDEQSESARRGELPKSLILASGDKRAYPRRAVLNCKTQFYNWLIQKKKEKKKK